MKYIIKRNNDDELMHWKYIRRYKKNGKWVYVYDGAKTNETLEKIKSTIQKKNSKKYYKALEKIKSNAQAATVGKHKDLINKRIRKEKAKSSAQDLATTVQKLKSNLQKKATSGKQGRDRMNIV